MKAKYRIGAFLGLGVFFVALFFGPAAGETRYWIQEVEFVSFPEEERLLFTFDQEVEELTFKQIEGTGEDGRSFVALDLFGVVQEPSFCVVPAEGSFIEEIIYAQNQVNPDIVRVVFCPLQPVQVEAEASGRILTVFVTALTSPSEEAVLPHEELPPPPPPEEELFLLPPPPEAIPPAGPVEEEVSLLPTFPLITLNMRDADIRVVLLAFSRETGFNIVTSEDVSGPVTVILKEVTPEEALEAILRPRGYAWERRKNTLFVTAKKPLKIFRLQYMSASDCKDMLGGVISGDVRLASDDGLNTLAVEASPEDLEKIGSFISEIDTAPCQVMVEAKIIELNAGDESVLATNLSKTFSLSPEGSITASTQYLAAQLADKKAGLYIQVVKTNFTALMEAMQKRSDFNLLANPNIMTLNHQEAEIHSGEKFGYKTKTVTETTTIEKVEFLEVGTKLKFTPHVNEAGYIIMEIYPEISEGEVVEGLPQERSTTTSSVVMINDGETIAIGGLIKRKSTRVEVGIPVLSQLPLLGALFRRSETDVDRKEIVIFITPHVVEPEMIKPPIPQGLESLEEKFEKKSQPWILP